MRGLIHREPYQQHLRGPAILALAATVAIYAAPAAAAGQAADSPPKGKPRKTSKITEASKKPSATQQAAAPETATHGAKANDLRQMFTHGSVDGALRILYFANHNAFFDDHANRDTATVGGKLGFTSAALNGFSLRLSAYAQRNFTRTNGRNGYNRDLGHDISTLGEAYLQWQGHDLRIRAGNQLLDAPPFTATYDYRIIPQIYQGVKVRYGNDTRYLTAMRMFRYKSRINDSFDRTTNYNASFKPFPPNTTDKTDGFWAVGGADGIDAGPTHLSGQAWFFNYQDYANMYYADGTLARRQGSIHPFITAQFIRETDEGDALIGPIDNHTYGVQMGVKHHSLTATLNYDYIPHRSGTFLNGALATPYATQEASGPLFAQPFLTSTQDLGSGSAYAAEVKGSPVEHTFLGARYSYMDLKPTGNSRSIGQSEYLVYGIYHFQGALEGLSLQDFFAYQTQKTSPVDFFENRLKLQYSF